MRLGPFGSASSGGNVPQRLVLWSGRKEKIASNKTHSFLLVTEKDIGDLLMLKFKWEEASSWSTSSMLKMVSSWWSGDSDGANMELHKIRIRAGETQQKYVVSRSPEGHAPFQVCSTDFVDLFLTGWCSASKTPMCKA